MSLSDVDRLLLQRCLDRDPRAWRDFVDRFVGLVVHVVNRTSMGRGLSIDESTRDDLVAEVFLVLLRHDLAVLRRFRRQCSLATYLTVISRRVVIRRLVHLNRQQAREGARLPQEIPSVPTRNGHHHGPDGGATVVNEAVERIENVDEVQQMMLRLDPREASVVRMFHLEGRSYREISQAVGMSENSIGPMLNRARQKMQSGR